MSVYASISLHLGAFLFEFPRGTKTAWICIYNASTSLHLQYIKSLTEFSFSTTPFLHVHNSMFQALFVSQISVTTPVWPWSFSLQVILCFLVHGFCTVRNSPTFLAFYFSRPLKQKMNKSQLPCLSAWCCDSRLGSTLCSPRQQSFESHQPLTLPRRIFLYVSTLPHQTVPRNSSVTEIWQSILWNSQIIIN